MSGKVVIALTAFAMAIATAHSFSAAEPEEEPTMRHATGTFDVQITPRRLDGPAREETLGRFDLDKVYHGALEGTGKGQMLTAGSPEEGSAAYVALERFVGKLDGREGAFTLMHGGTMSPAGQTLQVTVVPGSGDGELAGISGTLEIRIEGRDHFYDLAYELPAKP